MPPKAAAPSRLEAIRAGSPSGSQNLDAGAYRDSVAPLLSYCANDVGWSVNDYSSFSNAGGGAASLGRP